MSLEANEKPKHNKFDWGSFPPRRLSEEEEAALLKEHEGFVRQQAKKFYRPDLDIEELVQEGRVGLLRGIRMFDESRGYVLLTYAGRWIRNYIRRFVRARGNTIARPIEKPDVGPTCSGGTAMKIALDIGEVGADPLVAFVNEDIAEALRFLPTREQEVIVRRFHKGMTLREIGEEFGTTRERIRQIEKRALAKLKARLDPLYGEDSEA